MSCICRTWEARRGCAGNFRVHSDLHCVLSFPLLRTLVVVRLGGPVILLRRLQLSLGPRLTHDAQHHLNGLCNLELTFTACSRTPETLTEDVVAKTVPLARQLLLSSSVRSIRFSLSQTTLPSFRRRKALMRWSGIHSSSVKSLCHCSKGIHIRPSNRSK